MITTVRNVDFAAVAVGQPAVVEQPRSFDRILVTQARLEGLKIVTREPAISLYRVAVLAA